MAAKSASQSGRGKSAATDNRDSMIDAALRLAATRRWSRLSLGEIAEEAGLTMVEAYRCFRSKPALLAAFARRTDERMLAGIGTAAEESTRDRLFDVIMQRFDVLAPHKAGLAAIARDLPASPLAAVCALPCVLRSMSWMLEAAGVSSAGPEGRLRVKGLAVIYARAARVWLRDDSDDLAATMAALDRDLRRAEGLVRYAPFSRARRSPAGHEEPSAA